MEKNDDGAIGARALVLGGILCGTPLTILDFVLDLVGAPYWVFVVLSAPLGILGLYSMVYGAARLSVGGISPEHAGRMAKPIVLVVLGGLIFFGATRIYDPTSDPHATSLPLSGWIAILMMYPAVILPIYGVILGVARNMARERASAPPST